MLISNHGDEGNFKISKLNDTDIDKGQDKWTDLIVPKEGQVIEEFDAFIDFIAVYTKTLGVSEILIYDINSDTIESIKMDGVIAPWINQNYIQDTLRFSFTSPLVYERLYEYNFITKNLEMIHESKLKGPEIITNRFITKHVNVLGHDYEEIPMTLIYKSNLTLNSSNKWLLHGYGAYGLWMNMGFNIVNLTAAERGWIVAMAHARGGGEKGPKWHQAGKLLNKQNSFL